ncbi:AraC family transcriptional regulator [Tritonibacter mobilis]|uniref:AraC family transcriptional regulator n=1 Tax=Tritonibacter mobilis TaxID=379347 RepID=UPI000B2D721F|nr:AraC family transcriptional regulator [Tritonibacter mobilis]
MADPQHFVFALVEDFTHMAFSYAVDPLRIANLISGKTLYQWSFASLDGETAKASNDSVTLVHHSFDKLPQCDRVFVLSGIHMTGKDHSRLIAALRRERGRGTAIGALCSGAYILARAGFLDGMMAAIHWDYHDSFMETFPQVNLVRNVFVADEKHVTASGGTATADLMLHLIERDHGYDLSVAVADQAEHPSRQVDSSYARQFGDPDISNGDCQGPWDFPPPAGAALWEVPQLLAQEILHGNAVGACATPPIAK